jgi:hypothetical protein
MQVRKLYDRNPLFPRFVDKAGAKDLIAKRVGSQHVIPTQWVGTDLADVDWSTITLPAVVKPTHASGVGRFLFGGKVSHIEIDIREGGQGYSCNYTTDWQKLPFYDPDYLGLYPGEVPRPARLEEMIRIAETIAHDIDFVRVDLYASADWVYVGELTFYPGGGFEAFEPAEYDLLLGQKWQLGFDLPARP